MEFRTGSIFFQRARGSGPRTQIGQPIVFPRPVLRATAGLTGYTAQFLPDDHHLGQFQVRLAPTVNANTVSVSATFGLRDWSGDWDDDYTGTVNFVVLAELEPITARPPRGDLLVVDAEVTQAIQFFRSATFLDPATAQPDNSVPQVAGKPTGIRLYVDHDAGAGGSPITSLSGELVVTSPAGTRTLAPVAAIAPRREALIQRADVSHTLNFVIPEELCTGVLTISGTAFPANERWSRSARFERTIRFVDVPSLRTYLVGVHYLGDGMDVPAPSQAMMTATLGTTERLFPTGQVLTTGYQVLDFDRSMTADIANGCGDGFGALLDALDDLRGDSSDIYYAELPGGVNTGNIGGCGRSGLASAVQNGGMITAHEIGHALGRPHVGCAPLNCAIQPANPESSYPTYGSLPRGSIGEFGYDPLANTAFDPASTFDLMSYAGPQWISPYNYARLLQAGGGPADGGNAPGADVAGVRTFVGRREPGIGDWRAVPTEQLELRLTIHRDGRVEREHGFHYPRLRGSGCGHDTGYVVEFVESDGRTLGCTPLSCSCNLCTEGCWPVVIRDRVPLPRGARRLRVYEGRDRLLHEEEIPERPTLVWGAQETVSEGVRLTWAAKLEGGAVPGDLRYIVQLADVRGVWRGVAPRSATPALVVPWSLIGRRQTLRVRVLASSGIATGLLEGEVNVTPPGGNDPRTPTDEPPLVVGPRGALEPGGVIGSWLRARGDAAAQFRWYDEAGGELAGGATLDLRSLPDGPHVVRAVAVGGAALQASHSMLVEKTGDVVRLVRAFTPVRADEPHVHPHPVPSPAAPADPEVTP
ncbi:MAG: hypothetical protein MUF21_09385 [Gemmatimonadaceae bacterium]|nr:hypothetical protein [Gemmatimonadaceae bacterium]